MCIRDRCRNFSKIFTPLRRTAWFAWWSAGVMARASRLATPIPDRSHLDVQAVSWQVTGSELRHKPGGRLPLLSARFAVTSATPCRAATNFVICGNFHETLPYCQGMCADGSRSLYGENGNRQIYRPCLYIWLDLSLFSLA